MRINFDRPNLDPEPVWITVADEREDAIRCMGLKRLKRTVKDDDDAQKQPDKEEVDADDVLPGDFATREEYEDALEDMGIDPDDAAPWEDG